jgi:hypothetical protein
MIDTKELLDEAMSIDHALDRLFNCTEVAAHQSIKNRIYNFSVDVVGLKQEGIDNYNILHEIAHWLSIKSDDIFDLEDSKKKYRHREFEKEISASRKKLNDSSDKLKALFSLARNTYNTDSQ